MTLEVKNRLSANVYPVINYSVDLRNPSLPYKVNVDGQKCGELLQAFGMRDNQIQSVELFIERGQAVIDSSILNGDKMLKGFRFGSGESSYSWSKDGPVPIGTLITLPVDWAWHVYCWNTEQIKHFTNSSKEIGLKLFNPKPGNVLPLFFTRRLEEYLKKLPREEKERGIQFADKLLLKGVSRFLSCVLAHEIKHALDFQGQQLNLFDLWLSLLMSSLKYAGLNLDRINPSERRARKFSKEINKNPNYRFLVTIMPREF